VTINFPVVPPTNLNPSSIQLLFSNVNGVGVSPYSLQTQVASYGGDGWGLAVGFDPMDREEAAPWIAFLASLRGQFGTFLFGPNTFGTPLGAGAGVSTPRVKGASQTGYTLETDGWTLSTEVLKKGDFFEIDSRLYMNLTDATTDGSGEVTLDVWPSLRAPADNALIITSSPVGLWRLTSNLVRAVDVPNTELYTITFEAQEAL